MLRVAREQVERVGQQLQDGPKAALRAGGAARKVDDECMARNATDAAAKGCEWRLLSAAQADQFGDTRNKAIAHCECGFGSPISLCQPGATCRYYQVRILRGASQCGD